GQVALGVDLAHEGPLPERGRELPERRRDAGLPDATLPGDEQQLAVEQGGGHGRVVDPRGTPGRSAEADPPGARGGADLDVRDPVDRDAELATPAVGQPEGAAGGERRVDVLPDR